MTDTPEPYVRPYDARDEPDYWTAGKIIRAGNRQTVWAICGTCGEQRVVDLDRVIESGRKEQPVSQWKLRCTVDGCGGAGHAKMTWVNPAKKKPGGAFASGKPRPGSYDFATGKRIGAWS